MIFVDTGAFVARYLPRDQNHETATRAWLEIAESRERLVTTNFVVDETLTLLTRRADARQATRVGRQLYASRALSILRPDEEIEIKALDWMERFHDQSLSFTDCVSFVLMKRRDIHRVFTFDHDFVIAGFEKLQT